MSKTIPLSEPTLNGTEWRYVKECLDTGWVSTAGKYVDKFEKNIAAFTGAKFAVAVSSGTTALQIALEILNVGAGDEVIVPTVTFIAPVNAIKYRGADPIFMDCDKYYNIDMEKTIQFIEDETIFKNGYTINLKTKRKIKVIIFVHIFGNACDLVKIRTLCKRRNIKIIEDAAESLGTRYKKNYLNGAHTGTIGDVGCLSFNGNKIITAGGGGMMLTNNAQLAKRAKYLSTQAKDDPIRYIHREVGYNFRLNNVQSAIGVAQLQSLRKVIRTKKENYKLYKDAINGIDGLSVGDVPSYANSNYWMYALQINTRRYGVGKEALMKGLMKEGVGVRPLFYLNHLQKPYRKNQTYNIENADKLLRSTLNIPCSTGLSKAQLQKVVRLLRKWKR